MRFRPCAVTVTQMPEISSLKRARAFFKDLESRINIDRPCVVLDCSAVSKMDSFAIHMMLCCLEEAMKRDGDVKLAAVTPAARAAMELNRVDRLFEIYDTEADAVNSFFQPRTDRGFFARNAANANQLAEDAA